MAADVDHDLLLSRQREHPEVRWVVGDAYPLPFASGGFDAPIGCDHFLLGARVAVQQLAFGASGGCAPPGFPVELTVSDTLIVQIQ